MKRALVTGGLGFLGAWIARQLLEQGVAVRVLARPGEPPDNLRGCDVELLEGDVLDRGACERAVDGVDTVFHAAAIYSDWAPDPTLMYAVNIGGTYNVLEAARRAAVDRVIYTASVASLGRPRPGTLGDERTAYESWRIDFPYSRAKYFSRELAESFAAWGLDVRIVCPGIVLGPGDLRPTPSGKLILNIAGGAVPPAYFAGGASYVDVRDAAAVHVLAAQRGRRGERYIAAAHNLDNLELIRAIQRVTGRHRRLVKLPTPLARLVARVWELQARRSGQPPIISRDFFEYALRPSFYDNRKARSELGATFRELGDTLADAIADFRARGVLAG